MPGTPSVAHLILEAATAADLMSPGPTAVSKGAALTEAVAMMTSKGFHAAPVIDESGRPVGVLSRSDVLIHHGESKSGATESTSAQVGDVMTPAVFSVAPDTPAQKVIEELVQMNVHQLYVVDANHRLVGVITAHDILRRMRQASAGG